MDRDLNAAKVLANQAVGYTVERLWTEYRRRFAVVAGSKPQCVILCRVVSVLCSRAKLMEK